MGALLIQYGVIMSVALGAVSVGVAIYIANVIRRKDSGTDLMREIAKAIEDGAKANVKRWSQAVELTSARAGLVLCADLEIARADREAVRTYARNLRSQLLAPPLGHKKVLSLRTGTEWTPSAEHEEILAIPLPDTVDAAFFLAVVQGEISGDAGYQRWADREDDPEVARLLRLNGREETIHAERAQQVHEILSR